MERAIAAAGILLTSRLSLVEAARALMRLRITGRAADVQLADAGRQLDALWARCEIWEMTSLVRETASQVAPGSSPPRNLHPGSPPHP